MINMSSFLHATQKKLAALERQRKWQAELDRKDREEQEEAQKARREKINSNIDNRLLGRKAPAGEVENVVSGSQSSHESRATKFSGRQEKQLQQGSLKRSRSSSSLSQSQSPPLNEQRRSSSNSKDYFNSSSNNNNNEDSSGDRVDDTCGSGSGCRGRGCASASERTAAADTHNFRTKLHSFPSSPSPGKKKKNDYPQCHDKNVAACASSSIQQQQLHKFTDSNIKDDDDAFWNSDDSLTFHWSSSEDSPTTKTTTKKKSSKKAPDEEEATEQDQKRKIKGIREVKTGERVDFTVNDDENDGKRGRNECDGFGRHESNQDSAIADNKYNRTRRSMYESEDDLASGSSSDEKVTARKDRKMKIKISSSSPYKKKTEFYSDSSEIPSRAAATRKARDLRRDLRRESYYDSSEEEDNIIAKKYSNSSSNKDITESKWTCRKDNRFATKNSRISRKECGKYEVDSSSEDYDMLSHRDIEDTSDTDVGDRSRRKTKKLRVNSNVGKKTKARSHRSSKSSKRGYTSSSRTNSSDDEEARNSSKRTSDDSRRQPWRKKHNYPKYDRSNSRVAVEQKVMEDNDDDDHHKCQSILSPSSKQIQNGNYSDELWSDDPTDDEAATDKAASDNKKKRKTTTRKKSTSSTQPKARAGNETSQKKNRPSKIRRSPSSSETDGTSSSSSTSDKGMVASYDDVTLPNDSKFGFNNNNGEDLKPTLTNPKFGPDELVPFYLTRGNQEDNNDGDDAGEKDNNEKKHSAEKQSIPASLNRYLAPFQREGVKFMYKVLTGGSGVILGDEMGCGKTIQVIALLCALFDKTGTKKDLERVLEQKQKAQENIIAFKHASNLALSRGEMLPTRANCMKHKIELSRWSPVLVIVPPSIVETWKGSLREFSHFSVVEYTTQKKTAALEIMKAGGADIMLLRKSLFQSEDQFPDINEIDWKLVVVDEFHNFKGKSTKISNHMRKLKKLHEPLVLGMSGTLMQNNHKELWNLVDLIETGYLGNEKAFQDAIGKPISYGRQKGAEPDVVARGEQAKVVFQTALQKIMIERKKADVLGEQLTSKSEQLILCDPSPLQKEVYRHVVELPDFDMVKRGHAPCDCGVNRHFFQKFYRLRTKKEQVEYWRNNKNQIIKQSECCKRIPLNPMNPRGDVEGEPKFDPDAAIWRAMKGHNRNDEHESCEKCPFCCTFPCMKKLIKLSSHVGLIQAEKIPENEQPGSPAFVKYHAEREFARVALGGVVDRLPGGNLDRSNSITDDHYKLSGKLVVLNRLLTAFYEEGSRVLLFAHSTQLLDLIQTWLKSNGGYEYRRMDGQTDLKLRQHMADEFNKDDSIFLFLLSIKATGQGLTLTGANRVIIFDVDWNPSWEEQAQDRAHRIGQTKDVKVARLISKGTIEEMIYLRQIYKTHLKKETLEGNDVRNSSAPRIFRGVQGDSDRKGELFGTENLFRFKDGSFLETIWSSETGRGRLKNKPRKSMGGLEAYDTAQLSSALLGIGDLELIIEEKEAADDIATIASRAQNKTPRDRNGRDQVNESSYSESDAELDDTLNVRTRAFNHNDLLRSDKGGAKVAVDDEEDEEEYGGGTQDAFQVYKNMADEVLEDPEHEEVMEENMDLENDSIVDPLPNFRDNSNANDDIVMDETAGAFEPTDIFKKFGQQATSSSRATNEPKIIASAASVPDMVESSNSHTLSRTIRDGTLSKSETASIIKCGNGGNVHTLHNPFNVSDKTSSSHHSALTNQDRSLSVSGARCGCRGVTLENVTEKVQDTLESNRDFSSHAGGHLSSKESPSKLKEAEKFVRSGSPTSRKMKGCSLFGCGNLDAVSTTFSAFDLGLDRFSRKKKKKKKKRANETLN